MISFQLRSVVNLFYFKNSNKMFLKQVKKFSDPLKIERNQAFK